MSLACIVRNDGVLSDRGAFEIITNCRLAHGRDKAHSSSFHSGDGHCYLNPCIVVLARGTVLLRGILRKQAARREATGLHEFRREPARCSGISPRQKCTPRVSRDRLLLDIPDRRPDVIGQGNLTEKGKPEDIDFNATVSVSVSEYHGKEPPASLSAYMNARGIVLETAIHSTAG